MINFKWYRNVYSIVRERLHDRLKRKYGDGDLGISAILSAIRDFRSYLVVMLDRNRIIGAASYYKSKRGSVYLSVEHLGVIEKGKGYGKSLMQELFRLSIKDNRFITLVSNGEANGFYEAIGMNLIKTKGPNIYELAVDDIKAILCM